MVMQLSVQWLRDWLDFSVDLKSLIKDLTCLGLEVDTTTLPSANFTKVLIGEVLDVFQHPNADSLRVCKVSLGEKLPVLNIVCGAKTIDIGGKYPVACVGCRLSPSQKIRKSKLRGVISEGMLCSAQELGLQETSEDILKLPNEAPVGEDFRDYFKLDDTIIHISITPNRGDCLSIMGIARDLAAYYQLPLLSKSYTHFPQKCLRVFDVVIDEPKACPLYISQVIQVNQLKASLPLLWAERLRRSGIRSVSPIVDILNYVMMEQGQPMHAFDADTIKGKLRVRYALSGESIKLLNGKQVLLTPKILVIADDESPLAIAGVMGSEASKVTEKTKTIVLESAYFDPQVVRYSASHYGIQTDASYRFERGVDPAHVEKALSYATSLLFHIIDGEAAKAVKCFVKDDLPKLPIIHLHYARLKRLLGIVIDVKIVKSILKQLMMQIIDSDQDSVQVTPPSYRHDILHEIDLIEDIIRLYGYDRLPSLPFAVKSTEQAKPAREKVITEDKLRQACMQQGYREVITYSFIDAYWKSYWPMHQALTLANPISDAMSFMRPSLMPGLIKTAIYQASRQQTRFRLFEIGQVFQIKNEKLGFDINNIDQPCAFAGLISGSVYPDQWGYVKQKMVDFFDIKGDVEAFARLTNCLDDWKFEPVKHPLFLPSESCGIRIHGKEVLGYIGRLHPKFLKNHFDKLPVYLFEISMKAFKQTKISHYILPSKYPSIRRDLSLVLSDNITYQTLADIIKKQGGKLLKSMWLFDIYKGASIKSNCQSLAVALIFQHKDRTLIESEIEEKLAKMKQALETKLNATMRVKV